MEQEPTAPDHRAPGTGLLLTQCLAGFWALHLVYRTIEAAVRDALRELTDPSIHLALACGFLLSALYCLALAHVARRGMPWGLAAAALLSLPFSLGYAALEVAVYYRLSPVVNGTTRADGTRLLPLKERLRARAPQIAVSNATGWYFFYFGLGSFFVATGSARRLREAERQAAAFQRLAQVAELRALRYQINPHFLFNTLNSLSTLILAGRTERAEAMVLALSAFFRASLGIDPTADVTLGNEIELQRLYLAIEIERFPQRLRVVEDIPDHVRDLEVPALILQPLIENAIKHGVARSRSLVTIRIAACAFSDGRLNVMVEDDARSGEGVPPEGTGIGLRNVRERLAARYGSAATCHHGPTTTGAFLVTLAMPAAAP